MKRTTWTCFLLALCALSAVAQAATVRIPSVTVQPGTASVPMAVLVSGSANDNDITGVEVYLRVKGPASQIGITALDVLGAGTVFGDVPGSLVSEAELYDPARPGVYRDAFDQSVTQAPALATIAGTDLVLAKFMVDIGQAAPGTYIISLNDDPFWTTLLTNDNSGGDNSVPLEYISGTITVVPEPSTMLMAGVAGIGMVVLGFRRRRNAA